MEKQNTEQPLLTKKKVYYENCPGCKVDYRKDTSTIKDFHIAKKEEDIGYYVGFVGASFMFGRTLTSALWGVIADRYGRKPVMILGTASVVVFNTLFGFSTSFWMAFTTRFLLGLMNGVLGPAKAYACEISRPEHQALALSLVSTARGIGLIFGPAIGGFLAQPADKYPNIISKSSLFGRFPYLLPCLCISILPAFVCVGSFWLTETLHTNHENTEGHDSYVTLESPRNESSVKAETSKSEKNDSDSKNDGSSPKMSLLQNWPLMSSIIVYCIFSLHDMAYAEIFSLWAVSPKRFGGLSFSTDKIGVVLSITGAGLLFFQLVLYPRVERRVGPIVTSRICSILSILVLQSYPFIAMLSGLTLTIVLNCASILKNVFSISIITGLFVLQNNAVDQSQRGVANGLAMTAMSLFKAFGPAIGGVLFSWAQKRRDASFLPGAHMIFFILNSILVIGFISSFKPFLATKGTFLRKM
ncbi:hypothetical protein ACHQM5_013115 [Ranunculus cassubicifolius]